MTRPSTTWLLVFVLALACARRAPPAAPAASLDGAPAAAETPPADPPSSHSICDQARTIVVGGRTIVPPLEISRLYCEHNRDGCCTPSGWNCNNAAYYDWWFATCPR